MRPAAIVLAALLWTARAAAQTDPGTGTSTSTDTEAKTDAETRAGTEMPAATNPTPITPTPTPTPTAGAESEGDEAAADAQVAAILADSGRQEGESALKLYGFADFSYYGYSRTPGQWAGILPEHLSFAVGNLNLYIDADIAPNWKSMVEVRFMFLPSGSDQLFENPGTIPPSLSDPLVNSGRYDVIAADYTDAGRPVPWGGINIERAYLEHTFSAYLRLRAGRFLTPWGIWNVDHGSPVIIGPAKPYLIVYGFFPVAQTGFELLGSVSVGDSMTLGYHLTLSNGRGPVEQYQDYDANKALGGRVFLRGNWLGDLTIGASAYGGTVTDRRRQINLATQQPTWFNFEHARELSLAADVRWLWRGLHVQAEAAVHQKVWSDGERPVVTNLTTTVIGSQPDLQRFALYVLAGYRLPFFNLMPYLLYGYLDTNQRTALDGASRAEQLAGGLNIRVAPRVVLKGEWSRVIFLNPVPGSPTVDTLDLLNLQAAWVF